MQRLALSVFAVIFLTAACAFAETVQFVFTSDPHYGMTRSGFRDARNVDAHIVNAALVSKINGVSAQKLPDDGGLRAGNKAGHVDFVVVAGDITTRQVRRGRRPPQGSAASWAQFKADYLDGLNLKDRTGKRSPVFVIPGNHDASNAVGFYFPMTPPKDATAMASIYNLTLHPDQLKTKDTYNYSTDRIHYSRDFGGIHFTFLNIWPDSGELAWLETDLKSVSTGTPVIIFAHDPPEAVTRHFTNPNGSGDINIRNRFENLLATASVRSTSESAEKEQRAFVSFLKEHPNVSAYFHGHDHVSRFYDYSGPDNDVSLPVVSVDSPMKGVISGADESRLSFDLATIDTDSRRITVRECFWNSGKQGRDPITFGASETIQLYSPAASGVKR